MGFKFAGIFGEILLYVNSILRVMSSKLPVALIITAVLIASVAVSTIPASNALIQRDYYYLNDQHMTARYGNTKVCGDHMCAPGEWDQLQAKLTAAQLGHQARNVTTTAPTVPTMPSNATTTTSTQVSPSVCQTVRTILGNVGVPSNLVDKVMADLGCK